MKIILIEDEPFLAANLKQMILAVRPTYTADIWLSSVADALEFFEQDQPADLIFSDISLGDGLSFEIFQKTQITCPVIFCTAYEEYAIHAFENNGVDFVLKPITEERIRKALEKIETLANHYRPRSINMNAVLSDYLKQQYNGNLIIHYRDKVLSVSFEEIALFVIRHEQTFAITKLGQTYLLRESLEELEKRAGASFFRANRQVLVQRPVILSASRNPLRKLELNLSLDIPEKVTVGKNKITSFMKWFGQQE
ncbi:MAG: LytTR family DNA-binding domain-containing protein [Cytophagaceae bacterium]|nr:LytTR family DNA-binding domain-containing protein [Cytophagaceae bacterium]